jgi:hypothetical protein
MTPPARVLAPTIASLTLLTLWLTATSPAAPTSQAHAAHTLSVKDEGNLHFVKSSGSTLIDEGHATGTIPATVKIHFVYNGNPNVSSHITIYSPHGTIVLSATGRLSSPTNPNPSFSGNFTITGGSSRYAHAHGGGKLYGVFHRRSYGMLVQTRGTLTY